MKLGFHYHVPAVTKEGVIIMPAYLGLFVDSIAPLIDQLVCFQHKPNPDERVLMDYEIKSKNVLLVSLCQHTSVPRRLMWGLFHKSVFKVWNKSLDLMLIRASTPLLPIISSVWAKPLSLLVVSDASVGIENLPQPWWRKEIIKIYAHHYQVKQLKVAKNALTFVNSKIIFDEYHGKVRNLILTKTTTLATHDFFYRTDTCNGATINLLFTGRISRTKGIIEIIRSISTLIDEGYDLRLNLVGSVTKKDTILAEIEKEGNSLKILDRIVYHGYKTAGTELLEYYRSSDIYIIASQSSSEGFPRTIWEAMASGLPVIATSVGSIPAYIEGASLIIPPKDSLSMTIALKRLLTDTKLRMDLIQAGYKLARGNTLEKRGAEMIADLEKYLKY